MSPEYSNVMLYFPFLSDKSILSIPPMMSYTLYLVPSMKTVSVPSASSGNSSVNIPAVLVSISYGMSIGITVNSAVLELSL